MVISVNSAPSKEDFQSLLSNTLISLKEESKTCQNEYLSLLGNRLEGKVFEKLCLNAKGTPFEDSIELVSGQKFPDIIANQFYGVEVKTTKSNQWKSIGSSIAEGTRVEDVKRIYMLFGKMCSPVDFKYRPYEDCLSDVVVTHSPRYQIDMNLKVGETIFDKIQVPYDVLRKQENPIKTVLSYYKSLLKDGESTWWSGDTEPTNQMIIRLWNHLSSIEKDDYMIKGFCLFPELFGDKHEKFNRFAIWLSTKEGVVCPNVRDIFTAGGTGAIFFNKELYPSMRRIFLNLNNNIDRIKKTLNNIDIDTLHEYWGTEIKSSNLYAQWCELITPNLKLILGTFPIEAYLKSKNG